jgi:hypothetical protein
MAHLSNDPPRSPSAWWKLTHLEPAVYRALIMAVFGILASLGIVVSDAIPDQVVVLVLALLPLIQGVWTRAGVTANDKVVLYSNDPTNGLQLVAGPAVPNASISEQSVERKVYQKAA